MRKLFEKATSLVRRLGDIARAEWRNVFVIVASSARTR